MAQRDVYTEAIARAFVFAWPARHGLWRWSVGTSRMVSAAASCGCHSCPTRTFRSFSHPCFTLLCPGPQKELCWQAALCTRFHVPRLQGGTPKRRTILARKERERERVRLSTRTRDDSQPKEGEPAAGIQLGGSIFNQTSGRNEILVQCFCWQCARQQRSTMRHL